MLCFGFVAKVMCLLQERFSYCFTHSVKAISASRTTLPVSRLGCTRSWEWVAGTADPKWLGGYAIPRDDMLNNKNWGEEEEEGDGQCFFPQITLMHDEALIFLEMVELPCADGKWWMNSQFCFAGVHCFTCESILISTHNFSHFSPFDFPPHPITGGESKWLFDISCLP